MGPRLRDPQDSLTQPRFDQLTFAETAANTASIFGLSLPPNPPLERKVTVVVAVSADDGKSGRRRIRKCCREGREED